MTIYDKADWHSGGEWPDGLPESQSFVHGGFYLAWLVDRGLTSDHFRTTLPEPLADFRAGRITGAKLLEAWDGALDSDMMSDEGREFSDWYYGEDGSTFLMDYFEEFGDEVESPYEVKDTRRNYERVKAFLDDRLEEWRSER